ncbi:hypothetical protein DKX38_029353 [Salix brachista]|uniref:Uncharacterized protein n=1 Tax=Salix brachista TaxID=2182728 RepID=A0A5N5J3T1_9ROSI|nr:hypothetical protein DKX38_029353 [Salix brachista]
MRRVPFSIADMDSTGTGDCTNQDKCFWRDLILPYVPNVNLCDTKCISQSEPKRSTLLYFRGRLKRNVDGRILAKLVAKLNGVEGLFIKEGATEEGGKATSQIGKHKYMRKTTSQTCSNTLVLHCFLGYLSQSNFSV